MAVAEVGPLGFFGFPWHYPPRCTTSLPSMRMASFVPKGPFFSTRDGRLRRSAEILCTKSADVAASSVVNEGPPNRGRPFVLPKPDFFPFSKFG